MIYSAERNIIAVFVLPFIGFSAFLLFPMPTDDDTIDHKQSENGGPDNCTYYNGGYLTWGNEYSSSII